MKLEYYPESLLEAVTLSLTQHSAAYDGKALSNVLWALARYGSIPASQAMLAAVAVELGPRAKVRSGGKIVVWGATTLDISLRVRNVASRQSVCPCVGCVMPVHRAYNPECLCDCVIRHSVSVRLYCISGASLTTKKPSAALSTMERRQAASQQAYTQHVLRTLDASPRDRPFRHTRSRTSCGRTLSWSTSHSPSFWAPWRRQLCSS